MTVYACWSKEPWETALLVSVHKTKFGAWRAGRRWLLAEYEDWEESRREFGHKDAAKPDRLRFFVKETTVETQAPTGDATSDPRLPHSTECSVPAGHTLEALRDLAVEWEAQANFLSNPHDSPEDKAAGRTYKECADILRSRFGV